MAPAVFLLNVCKAKNIIEFRPIIFIYMVVIFINMIF